MYFVVEGATQQELTGNYYKVDDMVKNGRSVYTNSFAAVFWGGSVWHMHVAQTCFFESPADVTPGLLEAVPVEGQWHPTTRRQGGADFSRLPPTIVHVGQPRLRPPDFVVHGCTGQHRVFNGAYAAAGRFRGHPMFRHVAATKRSCVMLCQDGRYELRRAERMQLGPVVAVAQKGIRPDHAQWRAIGENHSADHIAVASPTPSCPTALLPWAKQQLHQACRGGKLAAVQALVSAMDNEALHATVNRLSVDGRTPLMLACEHGHLEVVKVLCDLRVAHLNLQNRAGESALHLACKHGRGAVVEWFAQNARDMLEWDATTQHGETPLSLACRQEQSSGVIECILQLLAVRGSGVDVDVSRRLSDGTTPLLLACRNGKDSVAAIKALHEANAVHEVPHTGRAFTPFLSTCITGSVELVEYAAATWERNAPPSAPVMATAFFVASGHGNVNVARWLADRCTSSATRALLVAPGVDNTSPLLQACKRRDGDMVAFLLGMQLEDQVIIDDLLLLADTAGITPLRAACQQGPLAIVKQLVAAGRAKGPDVLRRMCTLPEDGATPLGHAVFGGQREVVAYLRRNRELLHVDLHHVTPPPRIAGLELSHPARAPTPLWLAANRGHSGVAAELLVSCDGQHDMNTQCVPIGYTASMAVARTPLAEACARGATEVVKELLNHGGNPGPAVDATTSADRRTPLALAAQARHPDVVRELMAHAAGTGLLVPAAGNRNERVTALECAYRVAQWHACKAAELECGIAQDEERLLPQRKEYRPFFDTEVDLGFAVDHVRTESLECARRDTSRAVACIQHLLRGGQLWFAENGLAHIRALDPDTPTGVPAQDDASVTRMKLFDITRRRDLLDANVGRTVAIFPFLTRLSLAGCAAVTEDGIVAVAVMPNLLELDLSGTAVRAVPTAVGHIAKLERLILNKEGMVMPPASVCRRGEPETNADFMKRGSIVVPLVVVGGPKEGKSSFAELLAQTVRPHGARIHHRQCRGGSFGHIHVPMPTQPPQAAAVVMYDFPGACGCCCGLCENLCPWQPVVAHGDPRCSGQATHFATHPLFKTHTALFAVVFDLTRWDAGPDAQELTRATRAVSWVAEIHAQSMHTATQPHPGDVRCPFPRVLLVGTHMDGVVPAEPRTDVQEIQWRMHVVVEAIRDWAARLRKEAKVAADTVSQCDQLMRATPHGEGQHNSGDAHGNDTVPNLVAGAIAISATTRRSLVMAHTERGPVWAAEQSTPTDSRAVVRELGRILRSYQPHVDAPLSPAALVASLTMPGPWHRRQRRTAARAMAKPAACPCPWQQHFSVSELQAALGGAVVTSVENAANALKQLMANHVDGGSSSALDLLKQADRLGFVHIVQSPRLEPLPAGGDRQPQPCSDMVILSPQWLADCIAHMPWRPQLRARFLASGTTGNSELVLVIDGAGDSSDESGQQHISCGAVGPADVTQLESMLPDEPPTTPAPPSHGPRDISKAATAAHVLNAALATGDSAAVREATQWLAGRAHTSQAGLLQVAVNDFELLGLRTTAPSQPVDSGAVHVDGTQAHADGGIGRPWWILDAATILKHLRTLASGACGREPDDPSAQASQSPRGLHFSGRSSAATESVGPSSTQARRASLDSTQSALSRRFEAMAPAMAPSPCLTAPCDSDATTDAAFRALVQAGVLVRCHEAHHDGRDSQSGDRDDRGALYTAPALERAHAVDRGLAPPAGNDAWLAGEEPCMRRRLSFTAGVVPHGLMAMLRGDSYLSRHRTSRRSNIGPHVLSWSRTAGPGHIEHVDAFVRGGRHSVWVPDHTDAQCLALKRELPEATVASSQFLDIVSWCVPVAGLHGWGWDRLSIGGCWGSVH